MQREVGHGMLCLMNIRLSLARISTSTLFFCGLIFFVGLSGCTLPEFSDPLPKAADLSSLSQIVGGWASRAEKQEAFTLLHFQPGIGNIIRIGYETEREHRLYRGLIHRDGDTYLLSLQPLLQPATNETQEVWNKNWIYFRFDVQGDKATAYSMRDPNDNEKNLEVFGTGFFGGMTYTPKPLERIWAFHKPAEEVLEFLKSSKSAPLWRKWLTFKRAFRWSDLEPDPFEENEPIEPPVSKPTFR